MKTILTLFCFVVCLTVLMSSCASGGRQAGHQEKLDLFHLEKEVK